MSQLVAVDLPYLEDLDLSNSKLTHGNLRLLTKLSKWPLMKSQICLRTSLRGLVLHCLLRLTGRFVSRLS